MGRRMQVRRGHQALGLCALLMGVMVISTSVAQAETGACWGYMNGTTLKCFSSTLEATPVVEPFSSGTLLIGNVNLEVLCTGAKFIEGGVLSANGSVLLGKVEFSGCLSRTSNSKLELLKVCEPRDPIAGAGKIRTEKITGLITLHLGKPDVLFKPDTGETLAKIFLGELCAVSEEIIVKGEFVAEDVFGKESFETHSNSHLMDESFSLHLMKVGINGATIDGSAIVRPGGVHNAMLWAGKAA